MMDTSCQLYRGAKALIGERLVLCDVRVGGGKISEIARQIEPKERDAVCDVSGCVISPGFVDIHVHGGGGSDFMDGEEASVIDVCKLHARHGTVAIFPTSLAAPDDEIFSFFQSVGSARKKMSQWHGARIYGVNLEGPWLNPEKSGAQLPQFLKNPTISHAKKIFDKARESGVNIALVTVAPELDGALELARYLMERGEKTLLSMGHSSANAAQVQNAMNFGYRHITHFYSAMNGPTRDSRGFRVAGMVEAGYLRDELSVEVICDGCHLPLEIVALVHKVKGINKMALITDAMRAAGMSGGEYTLGGKGYGQIAIIEDGVAKLKDSKVFAGSVCTMDMAVKTAVRAGISLSDALFMASTTPAELGGCSDSCGKILVGRNADLVFFDETSLDVKFTLIEGKNAV